MGGEISLDEQPLVKRQEATKEIRRRGVDMMT